MFKEKVKESCIFLSFFQDERKRRERKKILANIKIIPQNEKLLKENLLKGYLTSSAESIGKRPKNTEKEKNVWFNSQSKPVLQKY